jgi:hypothetical protein
VLVAILGDGSWEKATSWPSGVRSLVSRVIDPYAAVASVAGYLVRYY